MNSVLSRLSNKKYLFYPGQSSTTTAPHDFNQINENRNHVCPDESDVKFIYVQVNNNIKIISVHVIKNIKLIYVQVINNMKIISVQLRA